MSRELRVLFGKEWKQAVRNRGALVTATVFPVLFMLVVPGAQGFMAASGIAASNIPTGTPLPPGLADASPEAIFAQLTFPLFLVMGGLVVPSVAASYTVVSEREKRTVDLLLALPVSLEQIVAAKIAAITALALVITLPLLLVDFVLLGILGLAGPLVMAGYLFELLTSLFFSVASAVAVALLARDFRTSNNLSGAFMGPMILIAIAFSVLLPWGLYRLLLHGALMAVAGAVILWVALRMVSLERFAL
jgi:ABC-type transport system involved in multi-copper enzyme maturation permease subunit